MSQNLNDFVRPTSSVNRRDINKILEIIHDLVGAAPEDEGAQERIMQTPHLKKRTTTVTFGGANLLDTDVKDRGAFVWRRQISTTVDSYSLIHTTVGSGLDFSYPTINASHFGAFCETDGTTYITIDDDVTLNPTNDIAIALTLNLPAMSANVILVKNNQYQLDISGSNTIRWRIWDGAAWSNSITFVYTPGIKFRLVAIYEQTVGSSLFVDEVSQGTSATFTGALSVTTNKLGILADAVGGSKLANTSRIFRLSMLNKVVTSGWRTDYKDGLLDTSGTNTEITTIPFVGNEDPEPEATSGQCKSG